MAGNLDTEFEYAALRDDYERDHDFIINTIAKALKERDNDTASELVTRYAPVAMNDKSFEMLANMLPDSISNFGYKHEFQLILEATPECEYDIRAELYRNLLKIEPENKAYQASLHDCENKLASAKMASADNETPIKKDLALTRSDIEGNEALIQKIQKSDSKFLAFFGICTIPMLAIALAAAPTISRWFGLFALLALIPPIASRFSLSKPRPMGSLMNVYDKYNDLHVHVYCGIVSLISLAGIVLLLL